MLLTAEIWVKEHCSAYWWSDLRNTGQNGDMCMELIFADEKDAVLFRLTWQ